MATAAQKAAAEAKAAAKAQAEARAARIAAADLNPQEDDGNLDGADFDPDEDLDAQRDAIAAKAKLDPATIQSITRDPEDGRVIITRKSTERDDKGKLIPEATKRTIIPWP